MCVPLDKNSITLTNNAHEDINECFIRFESIRHIKGTKRGMLMKWAEIIFLSLFVEMTRPYLMLIFLLGAHILISSSGLPDFPRGDKNDVFAKHTILL